MFFLSGREPCATTPRQLDGELALATPDSGQSAGQSPMKTKNKIMKKRNKMMNTKNKMMKMKNKMMKNEAIDEKRKVKFKLIENYLTVLINIK